MYPKAFNPQPQAPSPESEGLLRILQPETPLGFRLRSCQVDRRLDRRRRVRLPSLLPVSGAARLWALELRLSEEGSCRFRSPSRTKDRARLQNGFFQWVVIQVQRLHGTSNMPDNLLRVPLLLLKMSSLRLLHDFESPASVLGNLRLRAGPRVLRYWIWNKDRALTAGSQASFSFFFRGSHWCKNERGTVRVPILATTLP